MGPDIFAQILILFDTLTSTLNMTDSFPSALVSNNINSTTTVNLPQCCKFNPGHEFSHCDFWYVLDDKVTDEVDWRRPISDIFPVETSNIIFEVRQPKCLKGYNSIKISFDNFDGTRHGHFLENGYFGYKDEYYNPFEYCIKGITDEVVDVLVCEPECSEKHPCIRKCCRPDEIYSFQDRGCVKSKSVDYKPQFYHDMSHKLTKDEQEKVIPHYTVNFPRSFKYSCENNRTQFFPGGQTFADYLSIFTTKPYKTADFRVKANGAIIFRTNGTFEGVEGAEAKDTVILSTTKKCSRLMTQHYCLEGAGGYGSPNPFSNDEGEVFLATCAKDLVATPSRIGRLSFLYGNTMICSSIFYLLTVLVYLALKEKQNIHGWTIVSYASCMFFLYIFLGMAHLIRYYLSNAIIKTDICTFIGIGSHFFSLSSFLWLTVINYDLWSTFRKIRPSNETFMKKWRCFVGYCLFGWGILVAFISASVTIHFKHEEAVEYDCAEESVFQLPAYGRESCEIKQRSLGIYLYYPASALLVCNLLCFIMTTYKLCMHQRTTVVARKSTDRNNYQSFQIFGKLFFVMGVTRSFEILTWAQSGPTPDTWPWYYVVLDIFNALQAVAIFVIFVCKQDVIESLKKTYPNLKKILDYMPIGVFCSPPARKPLLPQIRNTQGELTLGRSCKTMA